MIREAKLFEAGNYPDKNLNVTNEDLILYTENFTPCPIKIEHENTAFDGVLGCVKEVFTKGNELFGKIDFISEAWSLIEKAGAKALSVCLNPDNHTIEEVSIVKNPRVSDARVFSASLDFLKKDKFINLIEENKNLKRKINQMEADKKAEKYFSEGKLLPSNIDIAKEFFMCEDTIKFNKENFSIKKLFENFLDEMPQIVDFSQIEKPAPKRENNYSQEQIELARKLGVDLGGEK